MRTRENVVTAALIVLALGAGSYQPAAVSCPGDPRWLRPAGATVHDRSPVRSIASVDRAVNWSLRAFMALLTKPAFNSSSRPRAPPFVCPTPT